jgi:FKBP-type peptidyl-prolyl cis-trans isomerase FkpA
MRKAAFFLLFAGMSIITLAQTTPDTLGYTKASDGSSYKIFSAVNGIKLNKGNFMEMNVSASYRDSILFSTNEDGMPQYGLYDTANFPAPFKEVFNNIHVGDSVILKVSTDSILAKGQAPDFMQSGQYIYQHYVITNVYNTKEQVDSAQQTHAAVASAIAEKRQQEQLTHILADNKDQIAKDSKTIEAWLVKNKLKAIKGKWGSYLVIKKAGMGKKLTTGDVASIKYTGRSFSTKKAFDSNIDPAFKHPEPYDVVIGQLGTVILGWNDALNEMQKGTKATVYIPSSLAWGSQGAPPDISPDEIVVFDMEVVGLKNEKDGPEVNMSGDAPKTPVKKAPVKTPAKKTTPTSKPKTTFKKTGK